MAGGLLRLLAYAARAWRRGRSPRPETPRSAPASWRRVVQPPTAHTEPPLRIAHETPRSSTLLPIVVEPCRAYAAGPGALLCQPGSYRRDERVSRASRARRARHPKRTRSAWTTLTSRLVTQTSPLVNADQPLGQRRPARPAAFGQAAQGALVKNEALSYWRRRGLAGRSPTKLESPILILLPASLSDPHDESSSD